MSRIIVIGDIHGCHNELYELLDKINYTPNTDRLISCGDEVDRGPESFKVVKFFIDNKLESVYSNHIDKHVRWRDRCIREVTIPGFKNKMHPLNSYDLEQHKMFDSSMISWMTNLPKYIKFEALGKKYIVVHGGFLPNIYENTPIAVAIRLGWLDKQTLKPYAWRKNLIPGDYSKPLDSVHWSDYWNGPEVVLSGHIVHSREDVYYNPTKTAIGLDTGCVFNGRLSALVIDEQLEKTEIVQVQSSFNFTPEKLIKI